MQTIRKKIAPEIREVIENGEENNHRSFIIMIGAKGVSQVPSIHGILAKIKKDHSIPTILWCYKDKLSFSSNDRKRGKQFKSLQTKGLLIEEVANSFQLFMHSNKIRFCKYDETHKILGQTFDMLVLQDFNALRPNYLARTIETVRGGGVILLLLDKMQNLEDLHRVSMSYHNGMRDNVFGKTSSRFNNRFILSIKNCGNCICIDDEFNLLPFVTSKPSIKSYQHDNTELDNIKSSMNDVENIGPIVNQTVTIDQARTLLHLIDIIQAQQLDKVVGITASRGRGKSTSMGLALAFAVAAGYSNIFVTAPSIENLKTLFEFVLKGLDVLGYKDVADYDIETTKEGKNIIRINIHKNHRQTICYVKPNDADKLGQCEILAIDEAAAIPLPLVSKLIGKYIVFMASTVNGYEGTGRSLSIKLFDELRKTKNERFTEVELNEPIRYAPNDPLEKWLHQLLCLDAQTSPPKSFPIPEKCDLMMVDRNLLFSGNKYAEQLLTSIVSLSVASHYKNEPDDLIMMSDSPNYRIFVLVPNFEENQEQYKSGIPDIICYILVSLEGKISQEQEQNAKNRGKTLSGDLIPWKVNEQYSDHEFLQKTGIRIVRIAVHPEMQHQNYGSYAITELIKYYESPNDLGKVNDSKALLKKPMNCLHEDVEYAGVAFGITPILVKFWTHNDDKLHTKFTPIYISQVVNEITGEHSAIVLRPFGEDNEWFDKILSEFRKRFLRNLGYQFRDLNPFLIDSVYFSIEPETKVKIEPLTIFTESDLERLRMFKLTNIGFSMVEDLFPKLAEYYFEKCGKVDLTRSEQTLLLMIGFQHHTFEECVEILNTKNNNGTFGRIKTILESIVIHFLEAFNRKEQEKITETPNLEE